jgi:3-dehydroquinate dehydratase/shikimate dehydrogenase
MICIPIVSRTEREIEADMASAAGLADVVELRMDYAPAADLRQLLEKRTGPVIVTNRPAREGGAFSGPEDERLALLQRAVDLGAEYVDVEWDSVGRIRRGPLARRSFSEGGRTKLIVSRHDFQRTPDDLVRMHADIVRSGADIAKIACLARDLSDNLRIFELLRSAKHPTIALCMGELGLISRILGRKFGNVLTYASLRAGSESAPGQITAAELHDLYRYKKIGRSTAIYGVIANPVAHSMSPAIHNAAFEETGLDAVYVPLKVETDPVAFVKAFRSLDVQGYSVTLPHKEAILPAMDEVDDLARRIGALNTVANRNGRLLGTNTDVTAAVTALEEALSGDPARRKPANRSPLSGKRVLLIGAGGAARAVAFGLVARGAKVTVANRTHERAVRLAQELGCDSCALSELGSYQADVLINTTSVGMRPNVEETPAPASILRKNTVVFDAVYNPPETRLIREAKAAGCRTITGIAWFVNQAAAQFELWTGKSAPREVMERVIRKKLSALP